MAELKKKIFYGVALTLSRFFFPIITYPYVSRVLGPDKIGLLNFSESYANYFVLVAGLGIPLYGVREVAKVRHDQAQLNRVSTEIAIIHLITSALCMVVFFILVSSVERLRAEWTLNLILGMHIVIAFFSLEWIFIGIEKFKFVTIRSIVTRLLPVCLIFVFVKDEGDYIAFQLLNTLAFLLNACLNLWFLRRYVSFTFSGLHIWRHKGPMLHVFLSSIFIQFYIMVDNIALGLISGYKSVGIYSAASKLMRILCVLVASVGNVLVPRISNLISIGEKEQAIVILKKSLRIGVALTIPISVGFFVLADEMIMIMYGPKFAESVALAKILAPIIVVAGVANVYTIQYLLPYSRESELLATYLTGTIIAIALNVALIFKMDAAGAAIAMVAAELAICAVAYALVNRKQALPIPWKYLLSCVLFSLLFWPISSAIRNWSPDVWITVISSLVICGGIYGLLQLIFYRDFVTGELYSLINLKKN